MGLTDAKEMGVNIFKNQNIRKQKRETRNDPSLPYPSLPTPKTNNNIERTRRKIKENSLGMNFISIWKKTHTHNNNYSL